MLELSSEQEEKIVRSNCRDWIKLMAQEWYSFETPENLDYPTDQFVSHLQAVYSTAIEAGLDEIDVISMLAFNVLRANRSGWDSESVDSMVVFYVAHAKGDNSGYAQNWIDIHLDESEA
jgi:hypothetical protein